HDKQALTSVVEPSDRIDATADATNQVHHRRTALGILRGRDIALGLIQKQVDVALLTVKKFAVNANVVAVRIGLAAQLRDSLPVDLHADRGDQLFGLAARGDSGTSDDFLQAFGGHRFYSRTTRLPRSASSLR